MSKKIQIDAKQLFYVQLPSKKEYYSYNTLVAVLRDGILYITDQKYSVTTSRHCTFLKKTLTYNTLLPLVELTEWNR